jgi:ATP sulfurylase
VVQGVGPEFKSQYHKKKVRSICADKTFDKNPIHSHHEKYKKRINRRAGHQWLMPIVLTTWEDEMGELWFEASLGFQKFIRPHLNQ